MQTFGYICAMLPTVQELYETNEEQTEKVLTYSTFFNTEPQVGSIVVGITAGMEEARANGEPVDDETINGIRAGLMGPLAGIGDSLVVGTLLPILMGTMVTASWTNINTSFQMLGSNGSVIVDLQKTLNDIYPSILSAVFVLICWYLLSKKRLSPVVVMLILVAAAFVGVLLGFFDPKLAY